MYAQQASTQRSRGHQKYQDGQKIQLQIRTDKLVLCNRKVSDSSNNSRKPELLPHGCKLPQTSQVQNIRGEGLQQQWSPEPQQTFFINLWPLITTIWPVRRQVQVDVCVPEVAFMTMGQTDGSSVFVADWKQQTYDLMITLDD